MSRIVLQLILVIIVSVLVHVLLGWGWTILAGLAAGYLITPRGWLIGGVGVALGWAILVGYAAVRAPAEVGEMTRVMGEVFGGMPGGVIVFLSVFLGGMLGMLGGVVGTQTRGMFHRG